MTSQENLSAVALPDELEVVAWLKTQATEAEADDLHRTAAMFDQAIAAISQAYSIIAALRAERDEAMDSAHNWHGQCEAIAAILDLHEPECLGFAGEVRAKFEAAEAQVKRLTEDNEALERHNQALLDKVSSEDCACAYDHPDDVCLGHSPKLKAAEARIKALEEELNHTKGKVEDLAEYEGNALNERDAAISRAEAAEAQIKALRDVLRPFAELADSPSFEGNWHYEDLFAARAILTQENTDDQ